MKLFMLLGSLNMFIAVALGAFGAHGLKSRLSEEMMSIYQTGNHYHMIHSLGLLLMALFYDRFNGIGLVNWAGWAIFIGIIIFSGSLYLLSTSGLRWLGAITPIGGLAFILGWILLALAAFKK
jgi:uncharacterized membrane protein YgdD (TMEM256/DUF423 family)